MDLISRNSAISIRFDLVDRLCMAMFKEIVLEVGHEENGPMTSFDGLVCVWRKLSGHHPQDVGSVT